MLLCKCYDPLSDLLDKKLGAGVTDHAIFSALPQRWEKEVGSLLWQLVSKFQLTFRGISLTLQAQIRFHWGD